MQQLVLAASLAALALTVIAIRNLFFAPDYRFPKAVAGVLVLRLDGDIDNSDQNELVSSLNDELTKELTDSKEASRRKMEVRASKESVTEEIGLDQAHKAAREIGRKSRAILGSGERPSTRRKSTDVSPCWRSGRGRWYPISA